MAHYAKVLDGKVKTVIVAEPEFFDDFIDETPGEWIKTSRNMAGGVYMDSESWTAADDQSVIENDEARLRKNFATVGGHYDSTEDVFYAPKPYESWTLDTETYLWTPPTASPGDGYYWDEEEYQTNDNGWILDTIQNQEEA